MLKAAVVAAGLAFLVFSPVRDARAGNGPIHRALMRPAKSSSGKSRHNSGTPTTQNMTNHGGAVMPGSTTYALYWGNLSMFPVDLQAGLTAFLSAYGGSGYSNILTQYMGGATSTASSFGIDAYDTSSPPSVAPSVSTIVNEVCREINVGALPLKANGVYFAITSNFPTNANYCAWHSYGTCNGVTIPVVYLPNAAGVGGCEVAASVNSYNIWTQTMVNIAAHEISESLSDPDLNAWYDSSGQEVGDKCAWQFGSPVNLGGTTWEIQKLWSNASSGCVQSLP